MLMMMCFREKKTRKREQEEEQNVWKQKLLSLFSLAVQLVYVV